ncbi:MAG TPA: DNA polymerase/3'-5' exonuclease PolX [Bacillota bacterium]
MAVNKKDVVKLLETIAIYLELKGENPFRISAYRRAAQALERDQRSLTEIDDFMTIKGIGKGTNALIVEYINTGTSEMLTELQEEVPKGLIPLLQVPGLGGKKLAKLYQELHVTDGQSLKSALESGQVEKLPGFGKKSVQNILTALIQFGEQPRRFPIASMLPIAEKIDNYLEDIKEVNKHSRAGSLRRMCETVGDLDFIIATNEPEKVRESLLKMDDIKEVHSKGTTKVSITLEDVYDVNVDFRLVQDQQFSTTLHHFTGSKEHNVKMRQLAKSRGEKINEYGVEIEATDEVITFAHEKDFFNHFGLHYIPPEVREGTGEVEAYYENDVELIQRQHIQGDLHMHTTWSDGAQSIEEMVLAARKRGYRYIAITDHSKFLRVANGLSEQRLLQQREEIERLKEKYEDIHIFAGVEMDILPDGKLDYSNEFLKKMDFVIAAIHSSFNQTEEQIMTRLYNALENPYVSLIAHPTGRLIGRRKGYPVNLEKLLERAKETNTALELNANPNRFDLSAEWVQKVQEQEIPIAINTDAHSEKMLNYMEYGVGVARKGWIQKETVMNTWSLEKLIRYLNRNK